LKNRQYSLKIFETVVGNEQEFIHFMDKHYLLFKDHLIVIREEMSHEIESYLTKKPFYYIHNIALPQGRSKKALEEEIKLNNDAPTQDEYTQLEEKLKSVSINYAVLQQELKEELQLLKQKLDTKFTVIDTIIRSGRELKIDGDLLLLNRVNSGATIYTTGNLIITQVVEGALRCDGKFMMITVSPKANIIFNGVEVDNQLLENKLNRIELKQNEIYITPVIKKEINWEQS